MKSIISIFLLFTSLSLTAQNQGSIQGVVLDQQAGNEPLPFANVFIKETQTRVITDINGNYQLAVDPGMYTVVFSFVGYQKLEFPNIAVEADQITTLENVIIGAIDLAQLKRTDLKRTSQKESVAVQLRNN